MPMANPVDEGQLATAETDGDADADVEARARVGPAAVASRRILRTADFIREVRWAPSSRLVYFLAERGGVADVRALDVAAPAGTLPRSVLSGLPMGLRFEVSADGWFTAAQLRDRLDNGRKVAIQMLEFLDRHGVTIRRGDLRRANPRQHDLFTPD